MDLIKHKRQLLGIAKSWAYKSLPGWGDDAHRDLIARHGAIALPDGDGAVTSTTMSLPQLEAALCDYERRGWQRLHRVHKDKGTGQVKTVPLRIAHIVRLWARLGQAGKVKSATRPALLGWVSRQVGRSVADLDALSVKECQAVTEALKKFKGPVAAR